ncbi:iron dependent repressor, metal binding and dimerization domain protein [Succinimonas sp.]|uniref:iron dependent repressor, metal binding and dimerization domain protein n=1 Tax=Succinimonas sp. TaxID=1936151 RepID=UPI0038687594
MRDPDDMSHLPHDIPGGEDYLVALYRLTEEQGRDITPEDLIHELSADPEETAKVLEDLQYYGFLVLDEGLLELSYPGRWAAADTVSWHVSIAAFLAGVLKLPPLEACRNAARIRNVIRRKALEGITRYAAEHHLDRDMPETEINFLFPSLPSVLEENGGYLFDLIYLELEDNETPSMEGISEATGMSLESIEEDARIMEKQGLLEKIGSDGVLAPTSRGLEMIYENVRRQMEITAFLTDTLGLEEIEAQSNAWKWKFLLSDEAMKAIRDYLAENGIAAEQR